VDLAGTGKLGADLLWSEQLPGNVVQVTTCGRGCSEPLLHSDPQLGYIVPGAALHGRLGDGGRGHVGRQGAVWAMAIVVGALGLAACGSSSPSSSATSTTAIAPAASLATGTYAPAGASGKPHYVITISSAESTQFDGAMSFVYQDGTTSHVFDFSGNVTGQSAEAKPTNVTVPGSATQTVSSVPDALRIHIGTDTLTFAGCQAYLPLVQSSSACTFIGSR
jgi:hypothetical protein